MPDPTTPPVTPTVRDVTFDVLRRLGLTTMFANPGSTEVPFLAGLPDDIEFVLALHEGSVVGIATGWAIAHDRPALVNLHTTAGLGNAVGALATARVNRAPLVVVVGQQDRRHLALEPFLAGRLAGLAGDYPVWVDQPVRAQDVPGAIARAHHEAVTGRGPAIVVVPMDDWAQPMSDAGPLAAATVVRRPVGVDEATVAEVAELLDGARSPALVVGAGADTAVTRAALVQLAERLAAPVRQEAFGARAGFPQDHPQYQGLLPAGRERLRGVLAGHDLVLVVGGPAFRQYPYQPGPFVDPGARIVQVSQDPAEVHRSPADLAVLTDPGVFCTALAERVTDRGLPPGPPRTPVTVPPPGPGEPLRAPHVYAQLARRLDPDTVVVEESPSTRQVLEEMVPSRQPLGYLGVAMGGLGFGMPAAIGVRMARPDRPVVAVLGDGSSMYAVQSLWTAARYGVGVLFVVFANGGYAIMDKLVERQGAGKAPWPSFPEVRLSALATALGCPARRISSHEELLEVLDDVLPRLRDLDAPLLLDVEVAPEAEFNP
ncbi:benzoylformate decarboxylase [Modestobacter sp. VKM Ac-2979]|uniref:benzoylformate decarboxylase n=1 Tax=unclassified Modestobacter TaxID=2643866 RepID=UPI0022ABB8AD|nr:MULTISPECIES: benzoylformate decarboxylase [unclassified Modestobacter]MCZ2812594.1 benzoylformate decarboxylase [Modestobacter sp. VKM Ac-2979]MCZ2841484.1 benzoylformate decarboxylase [Modestobacter sp. VKM Ac-2980]